MNIEKIIKIMKLKNISKYRLSQLSDVSETQIGKILNGIHSDPRISTVKKIAKALEVDINEII